MTKPQKAKLPISCAHCGEEFTPRRSTAKFCQDKCRILAFQMKQRDEARAAKKREAKNERRRKLEALRRNWRDVTNREAGFRERVNDAIRDKEEGDGDQFRIDRLTRERDDHEPLINRDKRRVERIALWWNFDMEIIRNPPNVNRKQRKTKAEAQPVKRRTVERPAFEIPPSKPMPKIETKRKRKRVAKTYQT